MDCNSIAIQADVSKESDCIKLIEETIKKYDRIDVLVNNAGIQQDIPFEETSIEEWYKIIGVDLTGPFVCSREAVKHMKKAATPKRWMYYKYIISTSNYTKATLCALCYV